MKKLLAILLSVFTIIGVTASFEVSAFASTEYDLWVNDVQVTDDNLTVACGNGTATFDPENATLTLDGAQITVGCSLEWLGSGILSRLDDLTVMVVNDSTIVNTGGEGISTYHLDGETYQPIAHNLTIKGNATLTISQNTDYYGYGIYATGNLAIDGAIIDINSAASGLWAGKDITINNSSVDIDVDVASNYYGIVGSNGSTVSINNSNVDVTTSTNSAVLIGDSNESSRKLVLNSGTLTLKTSAVDKYAIEANPVESATIELNGGVLDITTPDNVSATNIPSTSVFVNKNTNNQIGNALQGSGHIVLAIAAINHNISISEAVAPTCTETGLTQGVYCSDCKTVFVEQKVVDARGHIWDMGDVTTKPTCLSNGKKTYHCIACLAEKTESLPQTSHNLKTTTIPATYESAGKTETKCTMCGMVTATKTIAKLTVSGADIIKVTSPKKQQIKVTWKKNASVTGYEVQAATDKKFKKSLKNATVSKNSTTYATLKKLKSGKKYYVRIRSYKLVNGKKYYSVWSKTKTIKVK